jgi:flavorubredoxin
MFRLAKVKRKIEFFEKNPMSVCQVFNQWVRKQPKKECIVFDDTIWTFQDVNFKNINSYIDDFICEKTSML